MSPKVLSLDPATGKQNWSCRTDIGWYMVPRLVSDGDTVCVVGGRDGITSLAVKLGGQGDVTKSHRLWTSTKGSNVSSPILHEGHLYWMNDVSGIAFCAVAATGKTVYEERTNVGAGIYASPVMAEGRIYYVMRTGRTLVLPAAPRYEVLATNDLGEQRIQFNSSPAFAGGKIYLRTDRYLYCIGSK
jgi:outer membrane protein assembly factor BamB